MIIFRLLSLILVVVALLILGYDAFTWLQPHEGQAFSLTSVGAFIDVVMRSDGWTAAHSANWPSFVKTALGWPAWAVIGVLGLVLALIFRRRD